ncbi:hypothetical protein DASC09_062260 [Saccharomycopsis crataegensis]|uniref:Major facilitator superfamily (MFS) profile domain-containing protein n=1 Tax=Saccharomycopsis crataegensis TaxID=43959 RepID=A0AAV5QWT2_9ASCO|nr:hypothetical protein DASC09_062260 [Saccharomycopsis crataegensis]
MTPPLGKEKDDSSIHSRSSFSSSSDDVDSTVNFTPQPFDQEISKHKSIPENPLAREKSNISINTANSDLRVSDSLATRLKHSLSRTSSAHPSIAAYNGEETIGASGEILEDYLEIDRQKTRQTIISVLSKRADQEVERFEQSELISSTSKSTNNKYSVNDLESGSQPDDDVDKKSNGIGKINNAENSENQQLPTAVDGSEFASLDPELVTWNTESDPEFPRNWDRRKKLATLAIVGLYTFSGQYAASGITLGMGFIDAEFGIKNSYFSSIIVSIFLLSQGVFAMITSPLSEIYGRRVVLTTSIFCLAVFNIGCAVTNDPYSLFVCRFFLGICASGPMAIGSSVISDIYDSNDRGKYIILFSSCVNMAPIMGGLSSGLIVEYINWRWIFWVLTIVDVVAVVIGLLFFPETYSPVLLNWKCKKLRKQTGNPNLKTIYHIADANETAMSKIIVNVKRPLMLLIHHPMIYGLGIFMAFLFGYFYLILISFPSAWRGHYGYSYQTTALMYLSVGAGYLVFNPIWVVVNDREYRQLTLANNGKAKPEFRIKSLYLCGIFCPIGLLIYGWCIQYRTFWLCPCIGVFLYTGFYTGMFSFLINYVVDMNPRYSASSNAALSLFRSIFGFVFPIFAPKMYNDIGYGWGNTIFFFTGVILGIPFPFYVYKYGEKLRIKANLKFDKKQAIRDAKLLEKAKKRMEKA